MVYSHPALAAGAGPVSARLVPAPRWSALALVALVLLSGCHRDPGNLGAPPGRNWFLEISNHYPYRVSVYVEGAGNLSAASGDIRIAGTLCPREGEKWRTVVHVWSGETRLMDQEFWVLCPGRYLVIVEADGSTSFQWGWMSGNRTYTPEPPDSG